MQARFTFQKGKDITGSAREMALGDRGQGRLHKTSQVFYPFLVDQVHYDSDKKTNKPWILSL